MFGGKKLNGKILGRNVRSWSQKKDTRQKRVSFDK
jgi:hypothetical protein